MATATDTERMLGPDDLRAIDERLLDYLAEGRVTPAFCRALLATEGDEYSRGYVQERLARLEEHNHVTNLADVGLYELNSDPRTTESQQDPETDTNDD